MLRDFQQHAIDKLRAGYASGHRCQVLQLPTGAGKSHIAAAIIHSVHKIGGKPYFIVDRLTLVDQAIGHLENVGLKVGVIQGNHPQWNPNADCWVASIQTLARRRMPDMSFGIIDECHVLHKHHVKLMATYNAVPFIGLSATPFTKGLGEHFTNLVIGATTQQLTDWGYLTPAVYYAPVTPDLTGVRTTGGDYNKGALSEAVDKPKLVADIVRTWVKLGEDRPTLCFATNVAHSKHIASEFQSIGVNAVHIDAYTDTADRRTAIRDFREGKVRILTSCGVLTTGFDAPEASCVILARPTKSLMLHLQIIGRGLRTAPGKAQDCLVLDHAGNTERLGFATDTLPNHLDMGVKGEPNKPAVKEALPKPCPLCKFVKPPKVHICPKCGFAPEKQDTVEVAEGQLELISGKKRNRVDTWEQKMSFAAGLKHYCATKGYKQGWWANQYRSKYGCWPNDPRVRNAPPKPPGEDVMGWIKHQAIKRRFSRT